MRRKTNRVFRYVFPAVMVVASLFLLMGRSTSDAQEESPVKETSVSVSDKTQAKMLRLVSHNPKTQARLFVNANEAVQNSDRVVLNNPVGNFEKPEGPASLKSNQASYYQDNDEVHFLEEVIFAHHSGLVAETEQAVLNTKTQDITGSQGIKACHHENTITAKSYEIQTGENVVNFSGDVCLNVSRSQKN